MSEIQQRLDEAGEAIAEENEEIIGMIRELADRVYALEQENKHIEKELINWRMLFNPRECDHKQNEIHLDHFQISQYQQLIQ